MQVPVKAAAAAAAAAAGNDISRPARPRARQKVKNRKKHGSIIKERKEKRISIYLSEQHCSPLPPPHPHEI